MCLQLCEQLNCISEMQTLTGGEDRRGPLVLLVISGLSGESNAYELLPIAKGIGGAGIAIESLKT